MTRRTLYVLAAAFGLPLLACGSSAPSPTLGSFVMTASKTTVLANGTNAVTIHVEGAAKAPVKLVTTRGSFSGAADATVATTSGDVTLTTCDASSTPGCAGDAVITAGDAQGDWASVSVAFTTLSACASNCAVDPACAGATCTLGSGVAGTCTGTPLSCVAACAASETSCSDGLDNDCNGKIDCADTGCDGQPCKAGSPTWVCTGGACADSGTGGTGYALQISPARTRLPPNGSKTDVTVTVLSGSAPAAGVALTLSTTAGSLSGATATTDANGLATVQFTAPATPGTATITAAVTAQPAVSLSAGIVMPALGSIAFSSATAPILGAKASGWQESTQVSVTLLDTEGNRYPDGVDVRFSHVPVSGSALTLVDGTPCTTSAGTTTCTSTTASPVGAIDTQGLASVNLASGTMAGALPLTASATVGGRAVTAALPATPVIGAKASGTNFSIECSPRNVPALVDNDCSTSSVDAPITCVALLKDRYGNLLGRPTPVTFRSEAASIGQVATTPEYTDPTKDPTTLANLGSAVEIFNTLGGGLPIDVDPDTANGEPSVDWTDACGVTKHNPRDGVVTLIAIADGEDAFVDVNGNGVYDGPGSAALAGTAWAASGEPFVDPGEPFVDANDNGVWDPGEWFWDVNGNGKYDGPGVAGWNPTWSANTKIWTQTVVVYTGAADQITIAGTPNTYLGTRWIDSTFTGDACTPSAAPTSFDLAVGPPPTSRSYYVAASDGNLNRLAATTAYGVAVQAPASVTAAYTGLPAYADERGFFFQYRPCDKAGHCASQCSTATPPPGAQPASSFPCVMKPALFNYSCGIKAEATITAGSAVETGDVVTFDADLTYKTYGPTTKTLLGRVGVTGKTH